MKTPRPIKRLPLIVKLERVSFPRGQNSRNVFLRCLTQKKDTKKRQALDVGARILSETLKNS